jgi:CubicO group peptidase (beta-lactamase class C family)
LHAGRKSRIVSGVNELKVETDPAEVGLDAERLRRIDAQFARYVDEGKLAGWLVTVSRHGKLAHVAAYGQRDMEAGLPVEADTVWRIYSMTKPVTSVAAMMLYEEGAFELTDPVAAFIPSFADVRVYSGGSDLAPVTIPATEPVRIGHLLTHTAGLSYGFHRAHPVDAMYRAAGFDLGRRATMDLAAACDTWASIPLLFQPGAEWAYSVATDVLGRVVEVASGQRLDDFFTERILGPLGMTDTTFYARPDQLPRLSALYARGPGGTAVRADALDEAKEPPAMLSGGGGLISTAADYNRLLLMLLDLPGSPAGSLDGVRLLSPRTVAFMGSNHLPGGVDLEAYGRRLYAEVPYLGVGFGLGFAVVIDPVPGKVVRSPGEMSWGGAASTAFWVDQAEGLTVSLFTQLIPSSAHPLRSRLRQLVYQAIV